MKISYQYIKPESASYKILILALSILAIGAFVASLAMEIFGHSITNMSNRVPWGLPIVMAIHLVGLSVGSLITATLPFIFKVDAFRPYARYCIVLALAFLLSGLSCIVLDWGRPDRFFHPMIWNNPLSVFSVNGILYPVYMVICLAFLWQTYGKQKYVKLAAFAALGWGLVVIFADAMIFALLGGRELMHSSLLPIQFLAAAMASSTAMLMVLLRLMAYLREKQEDKKVIELLGKYLFAFVVGLAFCILLENLVRGYLPKMEHAIRFLLFDGGKYTHYFWGELVLLGIIIPLALLFFYGKSRALLLVAALLVSMGTFFDHYLTVIPAQVFPQPIFPGWEISSVSGYGEIVEYCASLPELVQSFGFMGLAFLLTFLTLRFLDIFPEDS